MWVEIEMLSNRHKHKAYLLLQEVCTKTVVKPQHFLRANEGSHISPFLLRAEEGSLPRKQNKL